MTNSDDEPNRRYAELSLVENGQTQLLIYDTENGNAWIQSTRSRRLAEVR